MAEPADPRHPRILIPELNVAAQASAIDRRVSGLAGGTRSRVPIAPFVDKVNDRPDIAGQICWRNDGYMWSQFKDGTWYWWQVNPGTPQD